jgi:hypothetical protein
MKALDDGGDPGGGCLDYLPAFVDPAAFQRALAHGQGRLAIYKGFGHNPDACRGMWGGILKTWTKFFRGKNEKLAG